mgnify:CR=1 FL=1
MNEIMTATIRQGRTEEAVTPVELPEIDIKNQKSVSFDGRNLKPGELVNAPNPSMPLIDAVLTRRTARSYRERLVDRKTFDWIVEASMNAPTACNEQQWKIILIDKPEIIQDVYERGSASFLGNAKQCFLICYNQQSDNS